MPTLPNLTPADLAFLKLRDAIKYAKEDRKRTERLLRIKTQYIFPVSTFVAGLAAGFFFMG